MTKCGRTPGRVKESGENKGTFKIRLQSAVAIFFMASFMNRNLSFISGFTHGFADVGRAVHATVSTLCTPRHFLSQ